MKGLIINNGNPSAVTVVHDGVTVTFSTFVEACKYADTIREKRFPKWPDDQQDLFDEAHIDGVGQNGMVYDGVGADWLREYTPAGGWAMSTAIQTKASGIQASPRKLKKKKCKNPTCRAEFIPARPLQAACSVPCALQMAAARSAKVERENARKEQAEAKEARKKLKSRSEYMKEAQQAFNEWIRMRDADQPCISCGRFHEGQWHAGHYRTVGGNPELRFEPLNVHRQCAPCNNHKSGDIVNYRINLVRRIGADKVDWLEGPHEPKRYTIDDLQAIKAYYRALTRELRRVVA